ncbi:MAG: universal stress protein, partial [Limisphaerales bacterium]
GDDADLQSVLLPLRRILVATDFSAESRKALQYGVALAREFDATLHLLHVVPTVLPADVSHLTTVLQEGAMRESAMRDLARMRAEEIPPDLPVVARVLTGNPFLELNKEALRACVGLIVASTHGYTGLRYLLLGSTAQHVVQHACVPVLVVREHEPEFVALAELGKENPP